MAHLNQNVLKSKWFQEKHVTCLFISSYFIPQKNTHGLMQNFSGLKNNLLRYFHLHLLIRQMQIYPKHFVAICGFYIWYCFTKRNLCICQSWKGADGMSLSLHVIFFLDSQNDDFLLMALLKNCGRGRRSLTDILWEGDFLPCIDFTDFNLCNMGWMWREALVTLVIWGTNYYCLQCNWPSHH